MSAVTTGRARRVFRVPLGPRLGSVFGVTMLGLVTVFQMGAAALSARDSWPIALFMLACAGLMAGLTDYVARDLRGKWGLRVVLDTDAVTLDLPTGRSLIHRPPARHLTIPYADIAGIDARFEAYGSLGMEKMQRAYVLRRRSGELVFLFEERALGTSMASSQFTDIIADLAKRAGVSVHDLGTIEGKDGLLGVWGAHAPDWAAPALPRQQAQRLWRRAALTGSLAMSIVVLAMILMSLVG